MNRLILIFLSLSQLLFFENISFAQDEKFYRELLHGELNVTKVESSKPASFTVDQDFYAFDLNNDHFDEYLSYRLKDGVPYLTLYDHSKNLILEKKLQPVGAHARPLKYRVVDLAPKIRIVIIYFDEGQNAGYGFHKTVSLYFLSLNWDQLRLSELSKGPVIFEEKQIHREQYYRRTYGVHLIDFNQDGIKEIAASYHGHEQIYQYVRPGQWHVY